MRNSSIHVLYFVPFDVLYAMFQLVEAPGVDAAFASTGSNYITSRAWVLDLG